MSGVEKRIPCPACQELGKDTDGDNLTIFSSGKFSCVVDKGKEHNRRIIELAPELGSQDRSFHSASSPKKSRGMESGPLGPVVATYKYQDENKKVLYEVRRHDPKTFRQYRIEKGKFIPGMDGVGRVPYRLPELIAAEYVWVTEGEKEAETLEALGFTATCNAGGAGKWDASWNHYFAGKTIFLCGDTDEPGRKHMDQVEAALRPVAKSLRRLVVPGPAKDISEHLEGMSDTEAMSEIEKLLEEPEVPACASDHRRYVHHQPSALE